MRARHHRLSFSFKQYNRLNKPGDYQRVFRTQLRFSDSTLLILARANGSQTARLGLAVSKKRVNRAVDRNLLKRLIRESFRLRQQQLVGWDIVVLTHRSLKTIDRKKIHKSLHKHWQSLITCKK